MEAKTFCYLLDITVSPDLIKTIEKELRTALHKHTENFVFCLDMAVNSNPGDAAYAALPDAA